MADCPVKIEVQQQVPYVGAESFAALEIPENARVRAAREAFRKFHAQCFWYLRADLEITLAEVPMIADGLRKNGGRAGFLLAAKLCR
jgi:hypothetical protein